MDRTDLGNEAAKAASEILGYLNFSSGASDPRFLSSVNHLFGAVGQHPARAVPSWRAVGHVLRDTLNDLAGKSEVFRQVDQAEAVLRLVFDVVLPAYRSFHRDILFHQTDESLFQPFFLGRVCEAVLQQGGPWDEADRITRGAITLLNDYLGYRPVAVLRTQQKIQPYAHEWVRPVPLFIRGAGVAVGRYQGIVELALSILKETDASLAFEALFDLAQLDELSVDPRAYDFDHPVNKRPNHMFGQWDHGKLDNSGRCRRFVLQQVSLDAILDRVENRGSRPYEETLFEGAAVLAGTMLMGSGLSGNRPDAHDSSATLATLVQHIAHYRDAFYEQLLERIKGPHGERLRAEAVSLRQPFGGARQNFNQHLARRRAEQVQHVHLAQLFARMGYVDASARQVRIVPVTSARMKCDMYCRLTTANMEVDAARRAAESPKDDAGESTAEGPADVAVRLERAAAQLLEIEDLLHRAIQCGALADPWNILGFGGQFSLFPAPENSVYDHRIDELIALVGGIFSLYVQIQKEAAAAGCQSLATAIAQRLDALAVWWDQYATTEVGSIESISGRETCESADHVAAALHAWHEAGTAAGDLAFWRGRAEQFSSAKAYALVVDALLEQRDPVAAMALLVQWLSQADRIALAEENYSFRDLALDWMQELWEDGDEPVVARRSPAERWTLARKFLDYLESNADQYWEVPRFELGPVDKPNQQDDEEESDELDDLFGAAYENVTFRDSTDDGFEGEMLEGGRGSLDATDFELVLEAERIFGHLTFLATLPQLWKMAAVASFGKAAATEGRDLVLNAWLDQATKNRRRLLELLAAVYRYRIPPPRGTHASLVEYDQRRGVKEMLLEQIIATCVETEDAVRLIRVAMESRLPVEDLADWEQPAEQALRAVLRGDASGVRKVWRKLMTTLGRQPLLYVAIARGGHPQRIVASRGIQAMLRRLLAYLPRLGMLKETAQLIATIQEMEMNHPVGPGAITEFDQMFKLGCKAIVRSLIASSEGSTMSEAGDGQAELIEFLEETVEHLLQSWLIHSRGVRLSVLESVAQKGRWQELKRFIERYGHDLFTQRFMNLGNLRAILHQGVDVWLHAITEEPEEGEQYQLLAEIDSVISREEAIGWLTIAIEAVVENYAEYVDYNSTTTQSDRGEMLYTLIDFLRLRASYDRVAWNLQPVILSHEVLVRSGRDAAAETWRSAVAERTAGIAEEHLKRFSRLNRKYGMRLPSIADRLGERFVRPLIVDRLRALIRPAMEQVPGKAPTASASTNSGPQDAFVRLEEGIAQLTREITGAGFDVPAWLEALEQEAERAMSDDWGDEELPDPPLPVSQVQLTRDEIRRQVQAMGRA